MGRTEDNVNVVIHTRVSTSLDVESVEIAEDPIGLTEIVVPSLAVVRVVKTSEENARLVEFVNASSEVVVEVEVPGVEVTL